jgi:hypothetical protein
MSQDQNLELYPALLGRTHENLFVGNEKPEEFYALLKSLVEDYTPASTQARALVEDAAISRWHLWRRQRVVNLHETALFTHQPDPAQWQAAPFRNLEVLQRYKNAAELSCRRAYANLETIRKENARTQRWELSFDLQKRKYDDVSAEIQAKSKLATIKLNQAIAHENEKEKLRACCGQERPSVVQKITVRIDRGVTVTSRKPSNKDVMAELAERAHHLYPPEQVVRDFKFPARIPREYDWIVSDESERTMPSGTQVVTVDEWYKMAAVETETGHTIGDPPTES